MSSIEDLLRDAYRDAAQTVTPQTVRGLDEQQVRLSPGRPRRRLAARRAMLPLAAAASVALVTIVTAAVIPGMLAGSRSAGGHRPTPSSSPGGADRFYVMIADPDGAALAVRDTVTGARVGAVAAPARGLYFSGLTTGDGRHYVAELWRRGVCRTWLYQFRLGRGGRPGPLRPFALPSVDQLLTPIAISRDNSAFGYEGERCADPTGRASSDLAVLNLATMTTRSWSIPKQADVSSLSLSADGGYLAFDVVPTKLYRSAAYVLPASAPPGPAIARSRRAAVPGRGGAIDSAVITPDGSALYVTVSPAGAASQRRWQLRRVDLATGLVRVIGRYPGYPAEFAADPSVRRALVLVLRFPSTTPTPTASPHRGSAQPTPTASPHRGSAQPTPSPTLVSPAAGPQRAAVPQLAMISLGTGSAGQVRTLGWDPAQYWAGFLAW